MRLTKAELQKNLKQKTQTAEDYADENAFLRARLDNLDKQLRYVTGKLDQANLTIKELCRDNRRKGITNARTR